MSVFSGVRKKHILQLIKLPHCELHRFNQYADKGMESVIQLDEKKRVVSALFRENSFERCLRLPINGIH